MLIATVANDVGTTVTGIQTAITFYTLVMASLMMHRMSLSGSNRCSPWFTALSGTQRARVYEWGATQVGLARGLFVE